MPNSPRPGSGGARVATVTVRELYPGYFALVMATGICSTALRDVGWPTTSAALLALAVACFAVLVVALTSRMVRAQAAGCWTT